MVPLHGSAGSSDTPLVSERGSPCLELFETVMTICDERSCAGSLPCFCPSPDRRVRFCACTLALFFATLPAEAWLLTTMLTQEHMGRAYLPWRQAAAKDRFHRWHWSRRWFTHARAHTHAQSQTRTSSRAHTSTHTRIALSSLENAHQCAFARAHKGTWTMRELVRLTKGDVDLVIAGRKKVSLCVIGAEGACPILEPSRVRDPTAGAYVVDRGADVAWPQCGMAPTAIRKRCVNRLDRG